MQDIRPITDPSRPKVYIETYGCQMNVNDSEVILSILQDAGYALTENIEEAAVILANTCSIRDNAEQRIWGRIDQFRLQKRKRDGVVIGIVGCMAERLKDKLLEKVDLVAGPDSYRSLPELLKAIRPDNPQINVLLSHEETCRHRAGKTRQERSVGIHFHNERLQQRLLILRRAVYPWC